MKSAAGRVASIIAGCIVFGVVAFFGVGIAMFALVCGGTPLGFFIVIPILLVMLVGLIRHIRHQVKMIRSPGQVSQPVSYSQPLDTNLRAIVTYLREAKAYGMSDEEAVTNLRAQGWGDSDIQRALAVI